MKAAKTGEMQRATYHHGGIDRVYDFYLPTSWSKAANMPLMICLHGAGSNSTGQYEVSRFDRVAEKEGFVVLYPNSTRGLENGEIVCDGASFYDDPSIDVWSIGWSADTPFLKHSVGVDDVGFLSEMIDLFVGEYGVNPKRVYVSGMSNGGMMCYKLVISLPEKIAGAFSVAGLFPAGLLPQNAKVPVKMVQMFSTTDPIAKYEGLPEMGLIHCDKAIEYWLKQYEITGEPEVSVLPKKVANDPTVIKKYTYPKGRGEYVLYLVDGAGHTWPGSEKYVELLGPISMQVDASELIWEELKNESK